jgi:hypothetical protein
MPAGFAACGSGGVNVLAGVASRGGARRQPHQLNINRLPHRAAGPGGLKTAARKASTGGGWNAGDHPRKLGGRRTLLVG